MPPGAEDLIKMLGLSANPEGGFYREIYSCRTELPDGRAVANCIYYMLTSDSPIGYLHRSQADTVHFFHLGHSLDILTVGPGRVPARSTMGTDFSKGHVPQVAVPGGVWKAFELIEGPFALISEAVAPAWIPRDHESAAEAFLLTIDSQYHDALKKFVSRKMSL
jgi:predicted cupin superfamily sugar epimerase